MDFDLLRLEPKYRVAPAGATHDGDLIFDDPGGDDAPPRPVRESPGATFGSRSHPFNFLQLAGHRKT